MANSAIPGRLPRRRPGAQLPRQLDRPPPFVGRARVPEGVSRWSADSATLRRLLDAFPAV